MQKKLQYIFFLENFYKQHKNNNEGKNKIPKEIQNAILEKVGEKEKETAKRILNKNSYSLPESNEKDW